ncbi:MAG: hypothetical protein ABWZ74_06580 [Hyphomicrobiaceae bacterium]|jgi:hypothetical protein
MVDKKDNPPKPPEHRPADAAGAGVKRPYTTLDLKATEVSSPAAKQDKEQAKSTGNPLGTATTKVAVSPAEQAKPDDTQAAAARVAAAAATLRQGSTQGAAAGDQISEERIKKVDRPFGNPTASSNQANEGTAFGIDRIRGYASHVAAGVLGGLIAVVGSQLLVSPPVQRPASPANDTALRDLQQKLTALEQTAKERPAAQLSANTIQRLQTVEAGLAQVESINRIVGTLGETQAKLTEQTKALQTSLERQPIDRDAAGRLDKVQEQLAMLSAAANADPQTAARIGQMAQVTTKLGELETRIAEASEAAKSATQRLEREMANARSDATRVSQRVEVLRVGSDRLEQSLRALQVDAGAITTAMEKLKSDIEAQLVSTAKPADISTAMAPVAAKIGALETSLQGVVRAESDRKSNAERIVLSLELASLKRAMDRGGNYAAELATVKKAAGGRIDLAQLERYQHDGVPTSAELAREFRGIVNTVLDADAEQPGASLVDRLLYGARTIVRVRKVTHSADDTSTEAIVGRIEGAVQENRLADAVAEAKKLSTRAAIPAQDWLKKAEARQSVDAALARVDADLKAALGGAAVPDQNQKGDRQ